MSERVQVLDHGYVELVEHWGSDARIIEAARMSTDGAFKGWGKEVFLECPECHYINARPEVVAQWRANPKSVWCSNNHRTEYDPQILGIVYFELHEPPPGDEKLLAFLWKHRHTTPFEMAGCTIEVQAPIFVFREWHRHRTQSYNELSARYTPLPNVNYVPTKERLLAKNDSTNKQAVGLDGKTLDEYNALVWLDELKDLYAHAQRVYDLGLELGVPKELARLPVPVARYSRMRASANLLNWLRFLGLRMDTAAQWEIRQFANTVGDVIGQRFPRTWHLFQEKKL